MNADHYIAAAEMVAQVFPGILARQGLNPLISRFVLSETGQGEAWLFVAMDDRILELLEYYAGDPVLSFLSTALYGHPVAFGTASGPHYAILLSPSKDRPETISPFYSSIID